MKFNKPSILVFPLLLSVPTSVCASPGYTTKASFCSRNTAVVACLKKSAIATPYCSSVLSIKPKTSTITKTVEPTPRYTTYTVTKTPGVTRYTTKTTTISYAGHPQTSTTTSTQTATATLTITTTLAKTCLTTGSSHATVSKRASSPSSANCACFSSGYPSASISAACSCLSLSTATSTITTTKFCSTPVISTTITVTPTTTSTIYTTVSIPYSTTIIVTTTTTTTTTSTTTATATSLARNGVFFREYYYPYDDYNYNPNYDTDYIQDTIKTPNFSGDLPDVNFSSDSNFDINYPGVGPVNSVYNSVVMQGFFVAPADGDYTFGTSGDVVDNWEVVWLGETAYNWRKVDKSYDASRTGLDPALYTSGSKTVTLSAGDILPITVVWGNGNYDARSSVYVITPDGVRYETLTDFLVQACGPLER